MTEADQEYVQSSTVGGMIRLARERKGMPRTTLAKFVDISPNSMFKYEKAGSDEGQYPSLPTIVKICQVLEIDPRLIFDAVLPKRDILDPDYFSFASTFFTHDFAIFQAGKTPAGVSESPSFDKLFSLLSSLTDSAVGMDQRLRTIEATVKSGPDQNDPSRPGSLHSNAAPTASDQHSAMKAKDDDPG